ncbi:MAG: hypothetical protein JW940_35970 [Polyangiaceae bacterium]|nr:hypothetical protein [Polyangiaceae bacterium]
MVPVPALTRAARLGDAAEAAPFGDNVEAFASGRHDEIDVPSAGVDFEVVGAILEQETIAVGREIRELPRLRRVYGRGRWRKRKGIARIRVGDGTILTAELHWYEAHGIGRKELKIKRLIP